MIPTKFQFIWSSVSEKNFFFKPPIKNKNCLWRPCLFTDQDEISNIYRGPSIDASYQVSVYVKSWLVEKKKSFGLFGQVVSEVLEIDLSETRMACGGHVC